MNEDGRVTCLECGTHLGDIQPGVRVQFECLVCNARTLILWERYEDTPTEIWGWPENDPEVAQ